MPERQRQPDVHHSRCRCGCGQKTSIAPRNSKRNGWTKGEPMPYVNGHNGRTVKRKPNRETVIEGEKCQTVYLSGGEGVAVSSSDSDWASSIRWHIVRGVRSDYAATTVRHSDGTFKTVRMHVEIAKRIGLRIGRQTVDHINGNGLDNRRSNLRLATRSQQVQNRRKYKVGGSAFKGVVLNHRSGGKYKAQIRCDGRLRDLGNFDDETVAAKVYDNAASQLFGEFACLNFSKVGNGCVRI